MSGLSLLERAARRIEEIYTDEKPRAGENFDDFLHRVAREASRDILALAAAQMQLEFARKDGAADESLVYRIGQRLAQWTGEAHDPSVLAPEAKGDADGR